MTRASGSGPKVVDLFAGAGLFGHAFERAGFDVIRSVELNRAAAATCATNARGRVDVGDVARLEPVGRCDVLIAGPPCQGFSTLGRMDSTDPRNRLSLQVARWAAAMRPRAIVIENVEPFLRSRVWKLLASRLRSLGYDVNAAVVDAADFGVAQHRVRSVTFATRRAPVDLQGKRRHHRTVEDAWDGLPNRPDGEGLNVYLKPTPLALARMRVIPPGGDKRDIMRRAPRLAPPSWWKTTLEVTDVWGRIEWGKPVNTLRTEFMNPSKGRYIHPSQNRIISLREAARLHSIPDDFEFATTVPYIVARQIGNSVPPLLGRAIARSVRALF